jgi:hypothetical protein
MYDIVILFYSHVVNHDLVLLVILGLKEVA